MTDTPTRRQPDPVAGLRSDGAFVADYSDPQAPTCRAARQHLHLAPGIDTGVSQGGIPAVHDIGVDGGPRRAGRDQLSVVRRRTTTLVNVEPKSTQTNGGGTAISAEGTLQVADQIVGVLQPDAETNQVSRNLQRTPGCRCVGHPRRMLDQRLDAPE